MLYFNFASINVLPIFSSGIRASITGFPSTIQDVSLCRCVVSRRACAQRTFTRITWPLRGAATSSNPMEPKISNLQWPWLAWCPAVSSGASDVMAGRCFRSRLQHLSASRGAALLCIIYCKLEDMRHHILRIEKAGRRLIQRLRGHMPWEGSIFLHNLTMGYIVRGHMPFM